MNPESRDTMKHRSMLGKSSHVNFKGRVTRSSSKRGDSTVDIDEKVYEDRESSSASVRNGDSGLNGGLNKDEDVSEEVGVGMLFGYVSKESNVSNNVSLNANPNFVSNSVDIGGNNFKLGFNVNCVPEMPIPVEENLNLNLNIGGNNNASVSSVNLNEVRIPYMFKIVGDGSMLNKGLGNNKLKYVSMSLNGEVREVAEMDLVLEDGVKKWSMIVCVIENGPWLVNNKPLFVRKWEHGLCMSKPDTLKVSLCVKIYDIPLEAWNVECISRISSRIGVPIIMDKITTFICEKPYGRASYAIVLVEVDAAKGLIKSVEIWYRGMGKSMFLNVEYVWRPSLCDHCKNFGHFTRFCGKKVHVDADKKTSANDNVKSNVETGMV
ncbi:brefeldin A-inhibited guanine nucleotide-exchange protein 5-like protein isoform X1 [Tanacetum coccineum]